MSKYPPCNMILMEPYKKKLNVGDIFVIKYSNSYFFGRVGDIYNPGKHQLYVVYVYNNSSSSINIIPELDKNFLLVKPCIINRLGFSRGYLKVVDNLPIDDKNGFPILSYTDGRYYYNSLNYKIRKPQGFIVKLSFGNYRTLDDEISNKIGIPLAPDE
jgi:hypothetical protein